MHDYTSISCSVYLPVVSYSFKTGSVTKLWPYLYNNTRVGQNNDDIRLHV